MKNIKDIVSTVCGVIGAISGALLAVIASGVELPLWVKSYAIISASIAAAVVAVFVGKNPDGSTKTPEQLNKI